jgi:hypothetical protein
MQPQDEAQETFAAWRIWILRTLDKLSSDVDELKQLTTDRAEYLRRFEVVEKEIVMVREKIGELDVVTAVSHKTLAIYSAIAAFVGSGGTAIVVKFW